MVEKPLLSFSIERILARDPLPRPATPDIHRSYFGAMQTYLVNALSEAERPKEMLSTVDEKTMLNISRFGGYATLSFDDYRRALETEQESDDMFWESPSRHLSSPRRSRRRFYRGGQVRFGNTQTTKLEEMFQTQRYLTPDQRKHLAISLGLSERQVKTWFQNRRAKCRRTSKENKDGSCCGSPCSVEDLEKD